jgi:colanic acid biosynthesis glycosyl transferase WcaI
MLAQTAAIPFLKTPDVLISASPSFPALLPAVINSGARRVPWVLWLHDILPDGATATGIVDESALSIKLARRLERLAYRTADRIVVLSRSFTDNLGAKGVPAGKIELIYDPATLVPSGPVGRKGEGPGLRILSMGNIGHSQGLTPLVRAFEAHPELVGESSLRITGTGVAADEARAEIRSDRTQMLGMVDDSSLDEELGNADVAFVSQRYEGSEFNIPSKLMNFMAYELPILAAVNPAGEVAKIVEESGAGWVVDSSDADAFPRELARLAQAKGEIADRAAKARAYADMHFTQAGFAERFERTLRSLAGAAG